MDLTRALSSGEFSYSCEAIMTLDVQFNVQRKLSRRTVLRGAGIALAMPWLTAMAPAFGDEKTAKPPRRFVAMTLGLGLHAENLNPKQDGKGYEASPYLAGIQHIRNDFTVISGASHPGVSGGH